MYLLLLLLTLVHAQQSPVTFDVLAIKKCSPSSGWSLHGFWPEYTVSKWPQWCNKNRYNEFNQSAIAPIQTQLDANWSPCPNWHISGYNLWLHEWEKHGTCTSESVIGYFNMALSAFHTAGYNNWYHCCDKATSQCLIPFKTDTTEWAGWCDTYSSETGEPSCGT